MSLGSAHDPSLNISKSTVRPLAKLERGERGRAAESALELEGQAGGGGGTDAQYMVPSMLVPLATVKGILEPATRLEGRVPAVRAGKGLMVGAEPSGHETKKPPAMETTSRGV